MKRLTLTIFILSTIFSSTIYAANEIRSFTNCVDAFAVVREIDGDVWYVSGQVFEAWGTSGRTALDYDIALTAETGGMFTGTMDTNIGAGYYYVVTHDDADSTPADADPAVWVDYGYWSGSAWVSGSPGTEVNVTQISGDSTAADNLELQYDTTGLAGDTFPSTQAQLANLANVGTAVKQTPSSYTLTTGVQSSGTVANTEELDGVNHEHTGTTVMDLYYEFTVGSGVPDLVVMTGYLNGNNDDLEVYGYDWVSTSWKQIGTLEGKAQSTNEVDAFDMFVNMVGFGADEGKVRVRFTDGAFTLTSATLAIDQIFTSFSLGSEGYDNGAIWINTNITNTNTVVNIDGTARNPVSTMAAANTLAASTNLDHFEIAPGSTITFAAPQENQTFNGEIWTLALGSQSISGSHIIGADVSGICTGATEPRFFHCHLGSITIPPADLESCFLAGTVTAGSAGDFFFEKCQSAVAGTNTPVFDFGSGLNASNLNFRMYSGGIDIRYMGAGTGSYNMSLEGFGQLIINANCSATSTIAIRGHFVITNSATGITLSDLAQFDHNTIIDDTLADTDELQQDQEDGGRLDLIWDAIKYKTDLITILDTTVKAGNDANNFTLNAGHDVNDSLWFHTIMVIDADDSHPEMRTITDYLHNTGSDPNIVVDQPFGFTPTAGDVVHIMGTDYTGLIYDMWNWLRQSGAPIYYINTAGSRQGVTHFDPTTGEDP